MPAYNFNAQQHEPQFGGGNKQLPPCKKTKVIATESSQEPTKDGKGGMLVFTLKVVEGPLLGKEQMLRLNLHNISAKAVEIANGQLSALCHVVNVPAFTATEQLHNIPFLIDVDWQKGNEPTQEKPEGGYTEITALYDVSGNKPGKAGQKAATSKPVVIPPAAEAAPLVAPVGETQAWQQNGSGAAPAPANNGWGNS
jgi:hypothetical protein